MKAIVNKAVKVLKKLRGDLYKIVQQYDYDGNKYYMIQCASDLYHQTNPMDKDVNFDFEGDCDALLTWKETGKRLTKQEYETYFDSTIFTKKSKDEIKYEDFIVVYQDDNSVQVSGEGYAGIHYTCSDIDYSFEDDFTTRLAELLPNKEVYEDNGRVGVWGK